MAGYEREVAYRLFARELRDTSVVCERDPEDIYAPQYVLTPTGAKANRVFIVGALIEKEDIGTDTEYWKIRVSDPTGAFSMYVGMYQPDAMVALAEIEMPTFVAVVGKVSVYTPENGKTIVSVKPESITSVDEMVYDQWIAETMRQTLDRIKSIEALSAEHLEMVEDEYMPDGGAYRKVIDALGEDIE